MASIFIKTTLEQITVELDDDESAERLVHTLHEAFSADGGIWLPGAYAGSGDHRSSGQVRWIPRESSVVVEFDSDVVPESVTALTPKTQRES